MSRPWMQRRPMRNGQAVLEASGVPALAERSHTRNAAELRRQRESSAWRFYPRPASLSRVDALALLGLAVVGLLAFRQHLTGSAVLVGNLDRPSSFLNIL